MIRKGGLKASGILNKQTISQASIIILTITILSKIIGYMRDVFIANYFGAGAKTDAFFIAMMIASALLGLIASGLQTVVIPLYTGKKKKNPESAKIFTNQIFLISSIAILFISIIILSSPTFFIKIFAYGFKGARLHYAVYFLRFLLIFAFFNVLRNLITGIYQAEKQFLVPAVTVLIANALIPISIYFLNPILGINSWTIGEISFAFFSFSVLFLILWLKRGFFKKFKIYSIDWREMKEFGILLLPLIFETGIFSINQIVDKTIASSLNIGAISALSFAQRIYLIPIGLFASSLAVAIYPSFSSMAAENNKEGYAEIFKKSFIFMMFIMIPISIVFIVLAHPIVEILFQHGMFKQNATNMTAIAVEMYSVGLFPIAINNILRRSFFSFKDTKSPLYITVFIISINIILSLVLSHILGIGGIALATAIAVILGFFLNLLVLKKKGFIKQVNFKAIFLESVKIILASLSIGIIAILLRNFINSGNTIIHLIVRLTVVYAVLIFVYLIISYVLKSEGSKLVKFYLRRYFIKLNGLKDYND